MDSHKHPQSNDKGCVVYRENRRTIGNYPPRADVPLHYVYSRARHAYSGWMHRYLAVFVINYAGWICPTDTCVIHGTGSDLFFSLEGNTAGTLFSSPSQRTMERAFISIHFKNGITCKSSVYHVPQFTRKILKMYIVEVIYENISICDLYVLRI